LSSQEDGHQELHDVRDEIAELQGRVGELGCEMAKLATATSNLSSSAGQRLWITISFDVCFVFIG
jgi:hypothetical protein